MALTGLFFLTLFLFPFATQSTLQNLYYTQPLTHLGVGGPLDNITFQQKYVVDNTFWVGAEKEGPFLIFFGGESPIDTMIGKVGVINEAAPHLGAFVVYIEHRFYGESVPYGSIDVALSSPAVRSYLSTEEALADIAEIISAVKVSVSATNSLVIVIGGSYAGMLAAWFRLKYAHIAVGALASSVPVLLFKDVPAEEDYCATVTRDFEQVNKRCSDAIHQSWNMIEEIALRPDGLNILTNTFNTCRTLNSVNELKVVLANTYVFTAQYNGAYNHWINIVCDPIVSASNPLEGIARALSIMEHGFCITLDSGASASNVLDANSMKAWNWQLCSEIVNVRGCNGYNPILPPELFPNRSIYMQNCWTSYGVWPRTDWIQTHYGGRDIKYGSNIIFSNGLMDPYSSAGILEDISKTIVSLKTKQGSHCIDLNPAFKNDPKWLKEQRRKEIMMFKQWISGCVRRVPAKAIYLLSMY